MSWQDPQGPWAKAMRRRVYGLTALFAPIPMVLALWALAYFLGARGERESWFVLPISAIMVVIPVWLLWYERRASRLVPLHEGLVCPRCLVVLQVLPADAQCPRCRRHYPADKIRTYWEQYAFFPEAARDWFKAQLAEPVSPRSAWCRKWLPSVLILLLPLGILVLLGLIGGGTFVGNLAFFSPLFLVTLVLAFISIIGVRRNQEKKGRDGRFCATCGYQQAPNAENSPQCPECGAAWTRPGGSILGGRNQRKLTPRLGLLALVLLLGLTPLLAFLGNLMHLLPTGALIDQLVTTQGLNNREWTALRSRTLSPDQERRLAEGLLDRRLGGTFLSPDDEAWFVAKLASGKLPRPIVERYYREMLKIWVVAPTGAKVGEQFRAYVGSEGHDNVYSPRTGSGTAFAYVSGFFAGDASTPLGRPQQAISVTLLARPEYTPAAKLVSEHPGPLRIRLVVWLVVTPPNAKNVGPIQWQADGTPVIPPGVDWAERVEAEATVQVSDIGRAP